MPKRVSIRSSIVRAAPTSACRMARVASTSTITPWVSHLDRRRQARERVDDRHRADLAAVEALVVNEVPRPDLVRSECA
jgi:hypothetical protein